ncbi:sulfite reductase [NADPH] flavoprotein component [Lithohypha guttulata]|uniref:assimilatory sulfite reductase (NADPH) n=1 Tax=Lithohypha guttulata TaxID=1690604 RepID=A0AAN7Y9U0_9EURO|nr:sulfite reductase [NADPH] flavoprotein component [Lithohypha guttulata]KAK5083898.1 sulfite reductase [NADPH] flavoprotein component [Lithohypha guttulata]
MAGNNAERSSEFEKMVSVDLAQHYPTVAAISSKQPEITSRALPFGRQIGLSSIDGPTYVTAQTLVQQVAYLLSDKIWSYSPETFDLDVSARQWSQEQQKNVHGYIPKTQSMDIRAGAGTAALGYLFSKDFDVKRRHIPQAVLASSAALAYMRQALDQLSLLYGVANPFVAHVAAAGYDGSKQGTLASDYISSMWLAEDLGFSLISSQSAHEAQHISLLATLLAQDGPVLHTYDGVKMARDTTRVIDTLGQANLRKSYQNVLEATSSDEHKHSTPEGKVLKTIKAFNEELGTDYKAFEYYGHSAAEQVLVTFGSVESSLAAQVAEKLAHADNKIGVVNVRLYRPFIDESFLKALPSTVRMIGVLGQVTSAQEVAESGIRSRLYEDVLAAVSFNNILQSTPEIRDIKFSRSESWSPQSITGVYHMLAGKPVDTISQAELAPILLDSDVRQYTFWNVDDSPSADAALSLAQALAKDSTYNVAVSQAHNNLILGGIHRVDVRKSSKSLDAAYTITEANAAVVTDVALLDKIDVLSSVEQDGKLILILPGVKDEDVEKKIPAMAKKQIAKRNIELYLINPDATELDKEDKQLASLITQVAFLRVALSKNEEVGLQKLAQFVSNTQTLEQIAADLEKTLRQIEVPKEWAETEIDDSKAAPPTSITTNSFESWDKSEVEPPSLLRTWQKAAKGLLFKEAYGTQDKLRPDLPVKTHTVHVKENRRLTPITYDRNIFHIEFDLGTSGLTYAIGEALGIHAENDHDQVMEFIKWYGLDPDEVVEVQAREGVDKFENRTVYQSLMQNVDIFGRPPKKFYEALAEYCSDDEERKNLLTISGPEGYKEFQRRAEVDTVTYADVLLEFPSAHPSFHEIVRIVAPMKRREYSIASCQAVTPTTVALMIVVVNWTDPRGRDRFGQATRYLYKLRPGQAVTVSVKPSVMKLPSKSTQPIIMAGLGTGLAPFRAFVQHRAMEKAQGKEIGAVLLYMGSRHQREEYCYGEEWEAYQAAGVITLLGRAFSRDQPQKIYIQDRMRQTIDDIVQAYRKEEGCFYLCGPTWPVADVTNVLEEAIAKEWQANGTKVKKGETSKEIMKLKDENRYVLEVY